MKVKNWFSVVIAVALTTLATVSCANVKPDSSISQATQASVLKQMNDVASWQLANPSPRELWEWHQGTFYTGLMAFYKLKPQQQYLDAMLEMGNEMDWKLKPHPYNADNLVIAQTYIDLYEIEKNPKYIDAARYVMDMEFHKRPKKVDLRWKPANPHYLHFWSWADSLFMAPPAFAQMSKASGDPKYLDRMDRNWKLTYNYLFDHAEDLFFRDDTWIERRTVNGKKDLWSRGNGWVYAGIVKILEAMPNDDSRRSFYEGVLTKMSKSLIKLQSPEGYWYASLLDKDVVNVKETSGTAFFAYGLAWGINNGLLDEEEFSPHVFRAWDLLVSAIETDGKLGFVQPVGVGADKVKREDTEPYGPGAFLLAGTEVYRLLKQ